MGSWVILYTNMGDVAIDVLKKDRVNLLSVGKEQRTSEIMISSEMTTSF